MVGHGGVMSVQGSLATLGVVELLQIVALFRKRGALCLTFPAERCIAVFFDDGNLSGLSDNGRVWHLGDLLACLGRLSPVDKRRMLRESRRAGKRLGQLLLEEGYLSRQEMVYFLRGLIMQSLLFSIENQHEGRFELMLGPVWDTSMTFPIQDFLMELASAVDELENLRNRLGPGGGRLALLDDTDLSLGLKEMTYRRAQVLAHLTERKTPMEVAAASPLSPTETLRILNELAGLGLVGWSSVRPEAVC
jgi:hypothetical protein